MVLRAVHEQRIDTILIEAGKIISGYYNGDTGEIGFGGNDDIGCGDIVEDILVGVMKDKRDIIVLPMIRMPTNTGIAAFFRY